MLGDKATAQITIRISEELKSRLEREAQSQGRPLANYVKAIINEHIKSIDRINNVAEKR